MHDMLRSIVVLALIAFSSAVLAQEVCDNGVDDDGNGLIDLNDPGCRCSAVLNPGSVTSFFPNHSFEQLNTVGQCCPVSFGANQYDPFNCLNGWNQTTWGTSDYMNPCGYYPPVFPPPPNGGAYIGFIATNGYQEYVGRCLPTTTLQAGVQYTLSFWIHSTSIGIRYPGAIVESLGVYYNDPIPITVYGTPACQWTASSTLGCLGVDTTFVQEGVTFTHEAWPVLASVEYVPVAEWQQVSVTFTPTTTIQRVAIGGACSLPPSYAARTEVVHGDTVNFNPYFLVDELMLNVATSFETLPVSVVGDVCSGDLLLTATPPAGSTDFQWYHDGVAIVGSTTVQFDAGALGLGSGVYSFTCNTGGECLMGWATAAGPDSTPDVSIGPEEGCVPLTVTFSEYGHTSGSTIDWWFGDGGIASGPTVEHTYTTPGIYDVRVLVNTPQGCVLDSTFIAAVVAHPLPQVTFIASPTQVFVGATQVVLEDQTQGAVSTRLWDLDMVPPFTADAISLQVSLPDLPGSYPVTLTVTDDHGCEGSATTTLLVLDGSLPEMPNVFSPNGDGRNDVFAPLAAWNGPGELNIYNRWGQLLYTTDTPGAGWDGRVNGMEASDGTYYYELTVHGPTGSSSSAGFLQLVR